MALRSQSGDRTFSAVIKFIKFKYILEWAPAQPVCGVDNVLVFLNIKQGRGQGYYSDWNMTYLTQDLLSSGAQGSPGLPGPPPASTTRIFCHKIYFSFSSKLGENFSNLLPKSLSDESDNGAMIGNWTSFHSQVPPCEGELMTQSSRLDDMTTSSAGSESTALYED